MDQLLAMSNYDNDKTSTSAPTIVRQIIAQYWLQILSLLVIIIYLTYYFTKVSKKPKLIGQKGSKFVQFIQDNLKQNVDNRFSPLMYFWGANAQTALFGYLQGRTSLSEADRDLLIRRQYLYVSDLQYLTSNKDLSKFYEDRKRQVKVQLRTSNLIVEDNCSKGQLASTNQQYHQQADDAFHHINYRQRGEHGLNDNQQKQHHENICFALQNIVSKGSGRVELRVASVSEVPAAGHSDKNPIGNSYLCPSCCSSSSDSGVFGANSGKASTISSTSGHSSGSSRASTSSLNAPISEQNIALEDAYSSSADNSIVTTQNSTVEIDGPSENQNNRKLAATESLHDTDQDNSMSSIAKGNNNRSRKQKKINNLNKQDQIVRTQFDAYSAKKQPVKERLEFGQCALDWFVQSHENYHKNKLVALISAGMTTGSDKRYVTDTVKTLSSLGYECCVFIRRGVGGLKLSSAKFFSPAKWRDFEAAVQSVRQQRPDARLVAIGFSFGSIELCRYLAMSGQQTHIDAALLVSCPFDPVCGGENMHNGSYLSRRIDEYLAKNLGKQLYEAMFPTTIPAPSSSSSSCSNLSSINDVNQKHFKCEQSDSDKNNNQKPNANNNFKKNETKQGTKNNNIPKTSAKQLKQLTTSNNKQALRAASEKKCQIWTNENGSTINLAVLPKLKSLHDFEYGYNRIVQHYPTREAYAQDCELNLSTIAVPTLCLSSEDDFMAPKHLLPIQQVRANPNLCMLLTKRGGHMAFVDGLVWPKKPYFAQRIISDYMGALRDNFSLSEHFRKQAMKHDHGKSQTGQSQPTKTTTHSPPKQQTPHIAIDLHHHHHYHHYIHSIEANKRT